MGKYLLLIKPNTYSWLFFFIYVIIQPLGLFIHIFDRHTLLWNKIYILVVISFQKNLKGYYNPDFGLGHSLSFLFTFIIP